ncbi:MAG: hypothetical protein RR549_06240 [Oscillospiraceae bacterium]
MEKSNEKILYTEQENKMIETIENGPKIKIKIPKTPFENSGSNDIVPVGINGIYKFFPRGENIEVAEEFARILEEGGYI